MDSSPEDLKEQIASLLHTLNPDIQKRWHDRKEREEMIRNALQAIK